MAASVTKSAVSNPGDAHTLSVLHYFEDMMLKNGSSGWVSVPEEFHLSEVSGRKYGEMAEKMVHDKLKKASEDIPAIKIIHFHNTRMTGRLDAASSENAIREADNTIFVEYQGLYFCKIMETKSNYRIDKEGKRQRKKAVAQLKNLTTILASELNMNVDLIQTHVMWPNMRHEEPCKCGKLHPTFTKLRQNPEQPGFHIFKNTFVGHQFSSWLENEISDAKSAIDKGTYEKLLSHFCLLSIGVLHDKQIDCFSILGLEQRNLVETSENTLQRPLGVRGLAGTGKTFVVCARIEHHSKSGELNERSKAAYVVFEPNVRKLVQNKLRACGINMDHVLFIDYYSNQYDIQSIFDDDNVLENLITSESISYLYFDSAEDMGFGQLQKAIKKILFCKSLSVSLEIQSIKEGDYWILFDDFQGIKDNHTMEKRYGNQLYWVGQQLDEKMMKEGVRHGRIKILSTSFRMPQKIVNHIKERNVIPMKDFQLVSSIEGIEVCRPPPIEIPDHDNYMKTLAKEILAEKLFQLTHGRGIHPGYCAILFDEEHRNALFPTNKGGVTACLTMLNEELKSRMIPSQAKYAPQVTTEMQDSIHHKHMELATSSQEDKRELVARNSSDNIRATVQHQQDNHPQSLLECECKTFVGSVTEMKGNEARIVLYLHAIDRRLQNRGELKIKPGTTQTTGENYVQPQNSYVSQMMQQVWKMSLRKKMCFLITALAVILASVIGLLTWWNLSPGNNINNVTIFNNSNNDLMEDFDDAFSKSTTNDNETIATKSNIIGIPTTVKPDFVRLNYLAITIFAVSVFFAVIIALRLLIYRVNAMLKKKQVLQTLPYYLAISRSSCEAHIIDIICNISVQMQKTHGTPVSIKKLTWRRHNKRKIKIMFGFLFGALFVLLITSVVCSIYFVGTDDQVIFVVGGLPKEQVGRSTEILDVSSSSSSCSRSTADIPIERSGHTVDNVDGVLIMCGGEGSNMTSCISSSSPSGPWLPHSATKARRRYHSSVFAGGHLHLVGGSGRDSVATMETLDLEDKRWTLHQLPYAVGAGSCSVQTGPDDFIVTGGYRSPQKVYMWTEGNHWSSLEDMNGGRIWHGCTSITINEVVYVVVAGGWRTNVLTTSELYNMETNRWVNIGQLVGPRSAGIMVGVTIQAVTKVMIIGGHDGANYYGSVEELFVNEDAMEQTSWKLSTSSEMNKERYYFGAVAVRKSIAC